MFIFFRKSITLKVTLILLFIAIAAGAGAYYFWENPMEFPMAYSLIGLGGIVLVFIAIYFNLFTHPLHKVLKEMKNLLTGRSYKRVFTKRIDEVGVIANFFNEITENLESVSNKLKEQKRMSSELEIASEIQRTILPLESPEIPGLEVVGKSRSAAEVGGDNFDFIPRGDNYFIYLGDVTGHGVPAGLIMMMANTLINTYSEMYSDSYNIIVNTNRVLKPRIRSAMFMTMVMLKWDAKNEKMSYMGCGHEHVIIFRAATGKLEIIPSGGIALGMVPDNSKIVKEKELKLEKDDVVLLYTDGITEAKNEKGEMYEFERFKESIKRHAGTYGPEGIAHHIAEDFSNFVGNAEQLDDISLIVCKYIGKEKKAEQTEKTTKWK